MLARKCGAVPIKLYLFARAIFTFFFRAALFQATMVFISYEDLITLVVHLHYIWKLTFTVNYHFAGFNGLTILSNAAKIQTTKLSILRRFYFHDVLEQLKTNFHKNFRFKRVLGFVIEYAWISKLLRDAAFTWQPRELSL